MRNDTNAKGAGGWGWGKTNVLYVEHGINRPFCNVNQLVVQPGYFLCIISTYLVCTKYYLPTYLGRWVPRYSVGTLYSVLR